MSQPDKQDSTLLPHGAYQRLRAYKVAEAIYDATVVFCDRFIDKRSRTHDQMVQAARSGVRNISEGSGAAATSKKSEIMLSNVARASLSEELLPDYISFIKHNSLQLWPKESPQAMAMRARLKHDVETKLPPAAEGSVRLTGLAGLADFVAKAKPELAANAMVCAVNQGAYLLRRLIERQGRDFAKNGGFSEHLYQIRTKARANSSKGSRCPLCDAEMVQRTAGKGSRASKLFWGCSNYPNCRGLINIEGQ